MQQDLFLETAKQNFQGQDMSMGMKMKRILINNIEAFMNGKDSDQISPFPSEGNKVVADVSFVFKD